MVKGGNPLSRRKENFFPQSIIKTSLCVMLNTAAFSEPCLLFRLISHTSLLICTFSDIPCSLILNTHSSWCLYLHLLGHQDRGQSLLSSGSLGSPMLSESLSSTFWATRAYSVIALSYCIIIVFFLLGSLKFLRRFSFLSLDSAVLSMVPGKGSVNVC